MARVSSRAGLHSYEEQARQAEAALASSACEDVHAAAEMTASGAGKAILAQLRRRARQKRREEENLETRLLEKSIGKICSLMAVGFGEAGSEIIAENMRNGGRLNPMIPGRKMVAVFGFCDIRQFTDTTEVLQEGIMEFVNQIAKIVHLEVARHGGSANKNIGDAFLLVWKFPDWVRPQDVDRCVRSGAPVAGDEISSVADRALASFVLTVAELRRSSRLAVYRRNPELCKRIRDFRVRMGFGLHVGWAIEGAIGSEFKARACLRGHTRTQQRIARMRIILSGASSRPVLTTRNSAAAACPASCCSVGLVQCCGLAGVTERYTEFLLRSSRPLSQVDASYLSPNVNMASRLEAATKQFGVQILLSSDFVARRSTPSARARHPPTHAAVAVRSGQASRRPPAACCLARTHQYVFCLRGVCSRSFLSTWKRSHLTTSPQCFPALPPPQSMLSPTVAAQCRQIDRVTVKGSNVPIGLYTFDTEPEMIADPAGGWDAYASGVGPMNSRRNVRALFPFACGAL